MSRRSKDSFFSLLGLVHPTEIRSSISPSSVFEFNKTSTLANYATEAGQLRRKNMPANLKLLKLKRGETADGSCNNILALKWKYKIDVSLLSTRHKNVDMTDTRKRRRIRGQGEVGDFVSKPKPVLDHNGGKCGVDPMHQVLSTFLLMRKYVKGRELRTPISEANQAFRYERVLSWTREVSECSVGREFDCLLGMDMAEPRGIRIYP
uniref:Uncharacterized protein n=1 Tax=Timema monikensis TaxID=170555 RepID=A0A7R9E966_9NEOP|nr:unnamed protein product [Timema monikensis]